MFLRFIFGKMNPTGRMHLITHKNKPNNGEDVSDNSMMHEAHAVRRETGEKPVVFLEHCKLEAT